MSEPDKSAIMQIDFKLDRHREFGNVDGRGVRLLEGWSEWCDFIGGTDEYESATRAEAAVAKHAIVGKWIAENARVSAVTDSRIVA